MGTESWSARTRSWSWVSQRRYQTGTGSGGDTPAGTRPSISRQVITSLVCQCWRARAVGFAASCEHSPAARAPTERAAVAEDPANARKVMAMANEPAPISFARGAPSLDIIDVDGLRTAADRAFSKDPAGTFAYGTSVGYKPLRSWIAQRHNVSDEQVLVTNGSMQADAFLFEALVAPGDGVVVERPTYDRTLLSLRGREATLHTVELEEDGVDVSAFADLLASGTPVTLAHLIPNFQNPAGYSLSGDKRRALVALAREYGVTIFEDDPYVELRFRGEPEPSMLSLATGGEVVYASSFSKTVCPGIRVGYLVGDAELIAKIAKIATNTYISPSMVSQSIVNEFVRGGAFDSSIETVKGALAERAGLLGQALRRELDRKSTRLNSSHVAISYAVFCLKKKTCG